MNELEEKAKIYAEEKANELIAKAIAQAYADGYRDGYRKCAEDYDASVYLNVEWVDLGLPSGTLWSSNYLQDEEGNVKFLTYEEASVLYIPTEEQVKELIDNCKWEHIKGYHNRFGYSFLEPVGKELEGPNGKHVSFREKGYRHNNQPVTENDINFWIRDNDDNEEKKTAYMNCGHINGIPDLGITQKDGLLQMPVFVVRNK